MTANVFIEDNRLSFWTTDILDFTEFFLYHFGLNVPSAVHVRWVAAKSEENGNCYTTRLVNCQF